MSAKGRPGTGGASCHPRAVEPEHGGAQEAQRPGLQAGHLHLGDPELGADVGLGHVPVKAQQQDALLGRWQPRPARRQGFHVDDLFQPCVGATHQV